MKNFAEFADPLMALTRKGVPFMWGSDQQKAFDEFCYDRVLVHMQKNVELCNFKQTLTL